MEFTVQHFDGPLRMAVAHSGDFHYGVAAGAYAGTLNLGGKQIELWGYGGIRNTETLNAYCLCVAVEELLADIPADSFRLLVIANSIGFMRYIRKLVPTWMSRGGLNSAGKVPDAYEEWHRCTVLANLGHLDVIQQRLSEGLNFVDEQASRIAKIGHEHGPYESVGIVRYGIGFDTAS